MSMLIPRQLFVPTRMTVVAPTVASLMVTGGDDTRSQPALWPSAGYQVHFHCHVAAPCRLPRATTTAKRDRDGRYDERPLGFSECITPLYRVVPIGLCRSTQFGCSHG
jgi:hypothetical protein